MMSETAAGPKHPRRTATPSGSQPSGRLRENPDDSPREETRAGVISGSPVRYLVTAGSRAEGESLSVPGGCFLLHTKVESLSGQVEIKHVASFWADWGVTCDARSFLKTAGKCCVCPTQYGRSCHEMAQKSARSSRTGSLQRHRKWETCVSLGGHWGHDNSGGPKSLRHVTGTPQPSLGP